VTERPGYEMTATYAGRRVRVIQALEGAQWAIELDGVAVSVSSQSLSDVRSEPNNLPAAAPTAAGPARAGAGRGGAVRAPVAPPRDDTSFAYVRAYYGVPAKRGARVIADGRAGVITSGLGHYIRIRLDGERRPRVYHPTWHMDYLDGRGVRG
jgi:hypothetical protein